MSKKTASKKLPPVFNQPDCILPRSFFEGRHIPNFHPESIDYSQWWDEQLDRLENGFSDGGYTVTPAYYYHLNFKKIEMVDTRRSSIIVSHPYFAFEDQQLFNDFQLARDNKKGIMLMTGRGFGKSFGVGSIAEHEFSFVPSSEIIISASIKHFADLLWEKIGMGLSSQPSDIRLGLLRDTEQIKVSGYSEKDAKTGSFRDVHNSKMRKIVYGSDADKTRGSRPNIHIFEEVGSWIGAAPLIECYKKAEASWRRGSFQMTLPILIGTGGAMDSGGSLDAKVMFNSPEEFGLMAFEYYEGEEMKKVARFIPAFKKYGGFYEKSGLSDEEGAKAKLDEKRKEKEGNEALYRQETSEFPYNIKELFQVSGDNVMPTALLEKQYINIVSRKELSSKRQLGDLEYVRGKSSEVEGVKWVQNGKGPFEILEHPIWTSEYAKSISGDPFSKKLNLYIAGCDSFDSVMEESGGKKNYQKSPGSIIMFKRFAGLVNTTSRLFVAKLTQRTDDASEFYENTIKLNLYYSSKMLAEYTMKGIFQHYKIRKMTDLLYRRPRLDSEVIRESSSTNLFGISMPPPVKRFIIKGLSEYAKENHDQIFFPSLLQDMIAFSYEGRDKNKHDETMAAALAVLGDNEMYKEAVADVKPKVFAMPVMRRDAKGRLVFS